MFTVLHRCKLTFSLFLYYCIHFLFVIPCNFFLVFPPLSIAFNSSLKSTLNVNRKVNKARQHSWKKSGHRFKTVTDRYTVMTDIDAKITRLKQDKTSALTAVTKQRTLISKLMCQGARENVGQVKIELDNLNFKFENYMDKTVS